MRKKVLAWLVISLAILNAGFAFAGSAEHTNEINKAFNCLDNKVETTSISLEEAVFAALTNSPSPKVNNTINQQKSSSESCWPNSGCTIKATAQVVLAKLKLNQDVNQTVNWLKSKSGVTQQMTWYLQISIESNEPSSCKINYDDVDHPIEINDEMKISGTPGSCLSKTASEYWLKIGGNCLEKEFSVQCDKAFKTNLLYERESGGTIYVSSQTHGASANAWTTEEIIAKCFKNGGTCDYEGSLWAASALYASGQDISEYAPYLRALASDNEKYFPSAFLVAILEGGDDHYANIIDNGRARPEGTYWQMVSSPYGKFYDTALAMLALGGADSAEIENAKTVNYLFKNNDANGCWGGGNIRDTAFIIYAARWLRGNRYCNSNGQCDAGENSQNCLADCPLPQFSCGDNVANGQEACDGNDLRNQTCASKGLGGGTLSCTSNCTFNVNQCTSSITPICGDALITGNEVCDCGNEHSCNLERLGQKSCSGVGYTGGILGCSSNCLVYDIGGCYNSGGNCTSNSECSGGICQNGLCVNGTSDGPYDPNLVTDCELSGLFCAKNMWACQDAGGNFFPQETHACSSFEEYCCSVEVLEATCGSLGGTVCPSEQPCTTQTQESSDGSCCVEGTCEAAGCASDSDCPSGQVCNLGTCQTEGSEECNDDSDCGSNEGCENGICVTNSGSNLWLWIVLFLVLIALVVLGIVYRDKLRVWWYQMKGKAKTSKGSAGPAPGMITTRRPPPRFGAPAGMRPIMGGGSIIRPGVRVTRPQANSEKEKDDEETLKKLKEMSK